MIKTFVLDTNVLLHSAHALVSFADNRVVIPVAVIEELDKFKKNQDELGRNSRQTVRALDALRKKGKLSEGVKLDNGPGGTESGIVQVIAADDCCHVPGDPDMSIADNRIIRVAYFLNMRKDQYGEVTLVTKDLNMRLRADALGIKVEDFETERVCFDTLYTGSIDLEVEDQVLRYPLAYVGVIGSRKKTAAVNAALRESGISEEALRRVHTPIGTPIKAVTPAEIAVSIAGEMICERAMRREARGEETGHGCPMHE